MRNLIIALILALPMAASAQVPTQHKLTPLGTLIDAGNLTSTQTFYVGRKDNCGRNGSCDPTSATDTSDGNPILGYSALRLELNYTKVSNGTLTLTCTEGSTRATATGTPSTATLASGTYTLAWSGVVVTPTLTASRIFPVVINLNLAPVLKCTVVHSATDGTLTIKGWLIAD